MCFSLTYSELRVRVCFEIALNSNRTFTYFLCRMYIYVTFIRASLECFRLLLYLYHRRLNDRKAQMFEICFRVDVSTENNSNVTIFLSFPLLFLFCFVFVFFFS